MQTIRFDGQQEGERVLYEAHPDKTAVWLSMIGVLLAAVMLLALMVVGVIFLPDFRLFIVLISLLVVGLLVGVSWVGATLQLKRNVTYITDRRVVRFSYVNPWVTTSRALFWDEVVKVKTFAPNWIYRSMNVGTVIVHARSTVMVQSGRESEYDRELSSDDLNIDNVSYFRDLGNYMDKVLYLYKKEPDQLRTIRVFIPKPRGQRY